MRILTLKEFLEIKEPVFYQTYFNTFAWGELSLKYKNCGDDDFFFINFMGQDIYTKDIDPKGDGELWELISKLENTKEPFKRHYDLTERDGYCDMEQRYVVYDKEDIKQLIKALQVVIDNEN